jgi:deoxyxylulose-5-phosphate synthase
LKIRTLTLPDRFIAHATPEEMYAEAELVKDKIVEKVLDTLNIKSPDLKIVDPKK